ncbi:putative transcriptional regulator [Candidatus Nitrososphaera evergladensis SR1]|jgi:predicted transcriptional regulator|uniref:Putative transcriptional regulator n=1 Tax=Candidatus Nitrososphaera evergladensis SR1 TaxID=1459636 RepID=A0A075MYN4_9ARCH|nr:winged helix-turn-helix domain-containing protein [Candidatus Nitrososphaera evergladensis]AIF84374.1 putative transcriptional regulator [Candidatus Nitrososphaera evergladensis SR1]
MKNRSRLDIAATILDIAQDGAIKTRIMYEAFLSFPQVKEYLGLLQANGALEYAPDENKYYTTPRGRSFLLGYKEIGRLLSPKSSRLALSRLGMEETAVSG